MAEDIVHLLRRGAQARLSGYDGRDVRRRARRIRRRRATVASAAVVLVVAGFLTAVLARPDHRDEPTLQPTPTASPSVERRFVPAARVEGDDVVMPVTFLDGTTAEIVYPRSLDIAGLGATPYGSGTLPDCCPRDFAFFHGPGPFSLAASDQPLKTFGPVRLLPGVPDLGKNYLVFTIGDWQLGVWDDMSDAERAAWAAHLTGHIAPDGFPVLTATAPLDLDPRNGGAFGPSIEFGRPGGQIIFELTACAEPQTDWSTRTATEAVLAMCRPEWSMTVQALGEPDFVDRVAAGIRIRNVHQGQ